MAKETEVLQVETGENGLVTLWLNRPHKRNAVSRQLLDEIASAVERVDADDSVRAVVFRGRGKTFCAGADLELDVDSGLQSTLPMSFQQAMAGLYRRIYSMRKPTLAAVEGFATAGGFELMLACDLALATSDAKIGDYHIRRGLFAGAGPLYRLPRIVGIRRTKELMMTGKLISGSKCAEWGLVNDSADADAFDALVQDWCEQLTDKSPFCMWMTKQAVNRGLDADTESLVTLEMMTVNYVNQSADAKEGVRAFVEKRQPKWLGR